jgi:hypothetical protein
MLTGGIFYCRDSAKINGCGSLQTSSWLDSEELRNPPLRIHSTLTPIL